MLTVLSLPESPRWLVKKGKIENARQVFAALDGVPIDHPSVSKIVKSVEDSLKSAGKSHPLDVVRMGKTRNFQRALLGFVCQCFQQIRYVFHRRLLEVELNALTAHIKTDHVPYLQWNQLDHLCAFFLQVGLLIKNF